MKYGKQILIFLMCINIILSFILSPFGESFDSKTFWSYWMSMSGILGIIFLFWQSLLGIRPFGKIFSNDFFFINGLHKRLGIGIVFFLFFHPIASIVAREQSWTYAFLPDFSTNSNFWITMGRLAFDLIFAILLTSVVVRKFLKYKNWYYIHLLSYPAFILAWLHGFNTGDFVYEGSMKNFYIVLGIILLFAILIRIFYQLGFLKQKVKIVENKLLADDIFQLILEAKNFTCLPGQFVYLGDKKTISHPFSILDFQDGKLKIAYKKIGNFTNFLSKKKPGESLYLDGSYGNFLHDAKSGDVFIAGGIGITPFYNFVHNKNSDISLIYLNQSAEKAVFIDELKNKVKEFYNIFSRTKGENEKYIYNGTRIDQKILEKILDGNIDRNFFICGSQAVVEQTTSILKNLGVKKNQIKFEPFSM